MDILFEAIGEVFVEAYMEVFVSLIEGFLPHDLTARGRKILTVILAILAMVIAVAAFIGGCLLLGSGGKSVLGWHLVGLAVVYLALGIILTLRKRKSGPKSGPDL